MPSFDIVSEIDKVELKNAVDNANRELATRFDFRGVEASFDLDKEAVKVIAEADFQVNQMMDMLRSNLAKRGVDARAMDSQEMVHSGKSFSQLVKFKNGIETPVAKQITKAIKDAKMKVQTQNSG